MFWVYVTTVPLTLLTIEASSRLVDSRANAFLVSGGGLHRHRRADSHLFILHPDNGELMGTEGLPDTDVQAALSQWLFLNKWASRTYAAAGLQP
jgi:hypothetical protein